MEVVGYCRLSRARDGLEESVSIVTQREDITRFCNARGWTLRSVHVDDGISGAVLDRPGLNGALDEAIKNKAGIVVRDIDRLGRSIGILNKLLDALDAGVQGLHTIHGAQFGDSSSTRLLLTLLIGVAAHEREVTGERAKRRARYNAEQGKIHGGGTRPFGLVKGWHGLVEEEAEQIRQGAAYLIAGGTLTGLKDSWNRDGLPPVKAKYWTIPVIRKLYSSPRIVGQTSVGAQGTWPAVLDETTWKTVNGLLEARSTGRGARPFTRWLNHDLICGNCGSTLSPHSANGAPIYGCTREGGCRKTWFKASPLEETLSKFLIEVVAEYGDSDSDQVALLLSDRQNIEARLADLAGALADGTMTRAMHKEQATKLVTQRDSIDADIRKLSTSAAMQSEITSWDELDSFQRRAVWHELCGTWTIRPAPTPQLRNARGHPVLDFRRLVPEFQHQRLWWVAFLRRVHPHLPPVTVEELSR